MMSHPLIPPKSKCFGHWGGFDQFTFSDLFGHFSVAVDCATPHERHVIACVAEVEWRRRSERWGLVRLGFSIRARREANKCNDIAMAWRQWALKSEEAT
jgi:hypothetical protein